MAPKDVGEKPDWKCCKCVGTNGRQWVNKGTLVVCSNRKCGLHKGACFRENVAKGGSPTTSKGKGKGTGAVPKADKDKECQSLRDKLKQQETLVAELQKKLGNPEQVVEIRDDEEVPAAEGGEHKRITLAIQELHKRKRFYANLDEVGKQECPTAGVIIEGIESSLQQLYTERRALKPINVRRDSAEKHLKAQQQHRDDVTKAQEEAVKKIEEMQAQWATQLATHKQKVTEANEAVAKAEADLAGIEAQVSQELGVPKPAASGAFSGEDVQTLKALVEEKVQPNVSKDIQAILLQVMAALELATSTERVGREERPEVPEAAESMDCDPEIDPEVLIAGMAKAMQEANQEAIEGETDEAKSGRVKKKLREKSDIIIKSIGKAARSKKAKIPQ